jgi:hypothetical protein
MQPAATAAGIHGAATYVSVKSECYLLAVKCTAEAAAGYSQTLLHRSTLEKLTHASLGARKCGVQPLWARP